MGLQNAKENMFHGYSFCIVKGFQSANENMFHGYSFCIVNGFQDANENMFHGFGNVAVEKFCKSSGNIVERFSTNPVLLWSCASIMTTVNEPSAIVFHICFISISNKRCCQITSMTATTRTLFYF